MIESFAVVAKEVAAKIGDASIESAKREVKALPDKIGDVSEVEALPDKIELVPENKFLDTIYEGTAIDIAKQKYEVATFDNASESDYPSSYKERIDRTPSETSDRGEWTGERGESTYIPSDEAMKELLVQFGINGIEYKDGIPDFSKCSACTVEIDNMGSTRYGENGNFAQCDAKAAEQWNKEGRNEKNDWTARDVKKWREENEYSWHERNDMKTCDLVPTKVNDYFGHLGGVAECKKRDAAQNAQNNGGDFDE